MKRILRFVRQKPGHCIVTGIYASSLITAFLQPQSEWGLQYWGVVLPMSCGYAASYLVKSRLMRRLREFHYKKFAIAMLFISAVLSFWTPDALRILQLKVFVLTAIATLAISWGTPYEGETRDGES